MLEKILIFLIHSFVNCEYIEKTKCHTVKHFNVNNNFQPFCKCPDNNRILYVNEGRIRQFPPYVDKSPTCVRIQI